MILRLTALVGPLLLLAWGVWHPAHADRPISVPEALLRAKPAVALIVTEVVAEVSLDCGGGLTKVTPPAFRETGTGWFIDGTGWVITNGHVVQPAHEKPRWLVNQQAQRAVSTACLPKALEREKLKPGERPDAEDAIKRKLLDAVLPSTKVNLSPSVMVVLSNGARLTAEVVKYSAPVGFEPGAMSGRDLALLRVPGESYPQLALADSRRVQIGDPVHILGFPNVVLSHELLNASASMEASVTNGAVSGFKQDKAGHPMIQTDASAAWGNSGGPAVDDRGAVVGVLTFVSLAPGPEGGIVQGFNFMIPSQAVRDFVQGTPVKLDGMGTFDPIWFAGLRAYFNEDWGGALRKFEQADRLLPNQPDIKRMLGEAKDKVNNPPPRPFPWFWVAIAVTLVSAGGYGAQFYVRWQRNRYRVHPSEVIRLLESGTQPTILDVRATEAYDKLPLKIPGSVRLSPEELDSGISGLELDTSRPVVAYCT
jgi:S1-C subfamily serine protease